LPRDPLDPGKAEKGGLMLQTFGHKPASRFERNPYFHFHPMHSIFSLIAATVLLGLVALFLLSVH
jgi:hypothetical protein